MGISWKFGHDYVGVDSCSRNNINTSSYKWVWPSLAWRPWILLMDYPGDVKKEFQCILVHSSVLLTAWYSIPHLARCDTLGQSLPEWPQRENTSQIPHTSACLDVGEEVEGCRHHVPGLCVLWLNTWGFDVGKAVPSKLLQTTLEAALEIQFFAFMERFPNLCLFGVVMSGQGGFLNSG